MKEKTIWLYCITFLILGIILGSLGTKLNHKPEEVKHVPTKVMCNPKECEPCNQEDPFVDINKRIEDGRIAETMIKSMLE